MIIDLIWGGVLIVVGSVFVVYRNRLAIKQYNQLKRGQAGPFKFFYSHLPSISFLTKALMVFGVFSFFLGLLSFLQAFKLI